MKRLLLMIVFSFLLIPLQTAVSGFDTSDISAVDVTGVVDGGEYSDDIRITFPGGTATLDGEEYISGTLINEIGYHTLVVYELGIEQETIHFTIIPRFETPVDGVETFRNVTVELENDGNIYINNRYIESGSVYDMVGVHRLEVRGANGYSETYSFTIKDPVIEYVKEHPIYSRVTIDVSKYELVQFEGEIVTEDIVIDEIGNYEVRVLYSNGATEAIEFTYEHSTTMFENGKAYDHAIMATKGSAQSWRIGTEDIDSDLNFKLISTVGHHTITFEGKNGYKKAYVITITEGDIGLRENMVFEDFFYLEYEGFDVTLNGQKYKSEFHKSGAGYYTVKITGVGNYTNTYNIFINEEIPFEEQGLLDDPQVIRESVTLNQDFKKIYVNGKEVENFRFADSGTYRIVYMGAGGYVDAYTVEFINEHESVNSMLLVGMAGLGALVALTYVFVLVRRNR